MAVTEQARRNAQIAQNRMSTRETPTSSATISSPVKKSRSDLGILDRITLKIMETFPETSKRLNQIGTRQVNLSPTTQTVMNEAAYIAQQAGRGGANLVPFVGNYFYEKAIKPSTGGDLKPQTALGETLGKAAYVTPSAVTLRAAPGLSLKFGGASAGISGGLSKALGGSFTEGAVEGFANAPVIGMVGTITNPIINKTVALTGKSITNPVTRQLATRSASSLLNIAEGVPMDMALGEKPLSTQSIIIDGISGFLLTPGANQDLVDSVMDLQKNKLKASKESIQKVQEALQTPENKEAIKRAQEAIASGKNMEQVEVESIGIKPEVKRDFDMALLNRNKEDTIKLLPEVPDEYKERFRPEIQSIIGKQLPTTETPRITQLKEKILNNLKKAQEVRAEQEASYTKERGQRKAIAEKLKEQYSGVELQQQKRRAIAGEYGKKLYSPEERLTKEDLNYIYDEMERSDKIGFWEKIVAADTLKTLFEDGLSPTNYQLGILRRLYGDDFAKQISDIVKKNPTAWQQIVEFAKIPRALQATADLSAAFRQGVWFITRPEFWKNMPGLIRFAFDSKNFQEQMRQIENLESYRAQAELTAKDRLAITEIEGGLNSAEEAFVASKIVNKVPILGVISKGSERSYVGFLNMLRASMFESLYQNAKKTGALERNPELLGQIATYVNTGTGRGKIEDLPKIVRGLSQLLFSPRLQQSRFELLVPARFIKADPFIRNQYIRDLSANLALGTTILQIAKMNGAETGDDPTSADFGKIKVGNTRIDIWGGFQQPMVLFARMIYGKKTSSVTGLETDIQRPFIDKGVPTYNQQTLLTLIGDFFNNKSSPETRYFLKTLNGFRDSQGNQLSVSTETVNLFAPLFIQSVIEVMEQDNPYLTAATAGLGVAGVNISTYGEQVPRIGETESGAPRVEYAYEPTFGDIVKEKLAGIPYTTLSQQEQEVLIAKRDRESAEKLAIQEAKKRVKQTGRTEIVAGKEIRLVQGEPTEYKLKELSYEPQDPAIAIEDDILSEGFFRNITGSDNVPQEILNYLDKKPEKAISDRVVAKIYRNDPNIVRYLEERGLFTESMANRIVLENAKQNPGQTQQIIYKRLNNLVTRNEELGSDGADLILTAFQEGVMDNTTANKTISEYKDYMTKSAKNKLIGDVAVYKMSQREAPVSERETYLKKYINEIKTTDNEVGADAINYLIKLYEQDFISKNSIRKILQGESATDSALEKYKKFIKTIE